ncbi:MAG: hypothetical protein PIR02_12300 [Microbacterium enclense]
MDEKVLLAVSHGGPLQTVTAAELRVNEVPLTIDPAASTEGEAAGAVR